ncbi:Peptidase_C39 like family protein [uncultured archaeon]|nr:Peptidase_C39 like family protein [uncultured archaeon]
MKRSKGMQLGAMLTALLLLSMMFVPVTTASANLNTAEKLARQYSANIWGINNTDIIDSKLYYGLDSNPAVYVFTVQKKENATINREYAGTIEQRNYGVMVIGATEKYTPLVEIFDGLPAHKSADLLVKAKELSKLYNDNSQEYKYIFLRNFDYGIEYNSNGKKIIVDLRTDKVISGDKVSMLSPEKEKAISEQWNQINQKIKNNKLNDVQIAAYSSGFVSGVPYYLWYRGCSPTAAGMVLGYWHDTRGYTSLPTGNTLIDELANAMGTDSNGATYPWDIAGGITTVTANHGYSFSSSNYYTEAIGWPVYKSEIGNSRPMVISIWIDNGGPYDDHSVTGVGYSDSTSPEQHLALVHDTWDQSFHLIDIGNTIGDLFTSAVPS